VYTSKNIDPNRMAYFVAPKFILISASTHETLHISFNTTKYAIRRKSLPVQANYVHRLRYLLTLHDYRSK